MPKSATIRARVEPELKAAAEATLKELGLSPTAAITLFYRQVVLHGGLPLELRLPNPETRAAMREAREGRDLTRASSADDFFAKLDADDDDAESEGAAAGDASSTHR